MNNMNKLFHNNQQQHKKFLKFQMRLFLNHQLMWLIKLQQNQYHKFHNQLKTNMNSLSFFQINLKKFNNQYRKQFHLYIKINMLLLNNHNSMLQFNLNNSSMIIVLSLQPEMNLLLILKITIQKIKRKVIKIMLRFKILTKRSNNTVKHQNLKMIYKYLCKNYSISNQQ